MGPPSVPSHLQVNVGKPRTVNVGIIARYPWLLPPHWFWTTMSLERWKYKLLRKKKKNEFECIYAARLRTERHRDLERQTPRTLSLQLQFASKSHTQVVKWTFHFISAAGHPSKPSLWYCSLRVNCGNSKPSLVCWEGWGNTPGWRHVHTIHGRANHLSFGKEWTMGGEFSAHSKKLLITKINWGQLFTHQPSEHGVLCKNALRGSPDVSWLTGADKKSSRKVVNRWS